MGLINANIEKERYHNQHALTGTNSGEGYDRLPSNHSNHTSSPAVNEISLQNWKSLSKAANNAANFIKELRRVSKNAEKEKRRILTFVVGPSKDILLHIAASHGNAETVKLIVQKVPCLLRKQSSNGDTVWHIAARTGKVIEQLYSLRNEFKNNLEGTNSGPKITWDDISLRDVNEEGNTVLHEALINGDKSFADKLVEADWDLSLYVNKDNKSALYLAAEAGYEDTVKSMLHKATASETGKKNGELKVKGKSILHAAKMMRNEGLLTLILEKVELTEAKDEEGMNPLHWAASIGFLEGVKYLLQKNISMDKDNNNLYPIHLASMNGHLDVVKELLKHHNNLNNLISRDGHNVLHLAAKYGRHDVVTYILHTRKTPEHKILINKRDKKKNTPLHLATTNWHPKVVSALTWDNRVDLSLRDEEDLTALDAAVLNMKGIDSFRQWLTWQVLKAAGAPRAKSGKFLIAKRTASMKSKPSNTSKQKEQKPTSTVNYKITVRALFLVSIIVALISFETGSTKLAYDNSFDTLVGITTTIRCIKTHLFVFCNTVSMLTSIAVIVLLIWAHFGDTNMASSALRFAKPLLAMALTMATLALMPGVYPVGSKHYWLVDAVLTTGMASLVSFATLFFPVCFPLPSGYRILHYITYFPIRLMISHLSDHLEE